MHKPYSAVVYCRPIGCDADSLPKFWRFRYCPAGMLKEACARSELLVLSKAAPAFNELTTTASTLDKVGQVGEIDLAWTACILWAGI